MTLDELIGEYKPPVELLYEICERVEYFGNQPMKNLRSDFPENCESQAETVRCSRRYNRGQIIAMLISDEFEGYFSPPSDE